MSVSQKIQRLLDRQPPRVLDLFAGCGGISLGFHTAGFDILGAIELDPAAARSHALNFHADAPKTRFDIHAKARDISKTEPADLAQELGLNGPIDKHIDVIVGGPPCQAFARVGRAKLREVARQPDAFLQDPRSNLYLRYLDYVRAFQPIALLMENVPDILNFGGHNVAEEICEALDDLGYAARYTMMNAVHYGVPEMRERMFLVAYKKAIPIHQWFPRPTHWLDLPRGYHRTRQVAMQTIKVDLFGAARYFVDTPTTNRTHTVPAVTAKEALSDLPSIAADSYQKRAKGPRRFDNPVPYRKGQSNDYQRMMRTWPRFEAGNAIYDHVIRYLPRDYKIFARMQPGDQYPEAHALALRMLEERLKTIEVNEGQRPARDSKRYLDELSQYVPPYDPGKFPNKWRKMEPNQPARTLMAHLGKDSYSHIHYSSLEARTISVREAARLQSFPDGFVFQGPMNPAFRQIGNAVPPLLAQAIAKTMLNQLSGAINGTEDRAQAAI